MQMRPKLFIKVSTQKNSMTLELENQPEGLEIVIVTTKEVVAYTIKSGDAMEVTMADS